MTNLYPPPQADVRDIAPATTGVVLAERSTRLGAALLDGVFICLFYIPFIFGMVLGSTRVSEGVDPSTTTSFAVGLGLSAVVFLIWLGITIMYMARNGQSIAKKLIGIKVVRSDGSKASLARLILLRNVVNTIIGIIPL